VAHGIGKLPAEQRQALTAIRSAPAVAEATEAVTEVEVLKATLRAALVRRIKRWPPCATARPGPPSSLPMLTGGDPAALLAAGVGVKKAKTAGGQTGRAHVDARRQHRIRRRRKSALETARAALRLLIQMTTARRRRAAGNRWPSASANPAR